MRLTITIESDNAAFEHAGGRTETGYLLRKVAGKIENHEERQDGEATPIQDLNGNTVGTFTFEANA